MPLTAGEIQRLHAELGSVEEILECKRAIYRLTLEVAFRARGLSGPAAELLAAGVVDNPAVRGHLGEVLSGTAELDLQRLRRLDDRIVAPPNPRTDTAVRLVSYRETAAELDGALRRVGADLGEHEFVSRPDAVVIAGTTGSHAVERTVVDGIELALELAPELVGDLLPHVSLLAVLRGETAGRLGSASVREYPGLVLLPEPRTPLEVAEALVHEGAHQKFFDLAMTNHVLATPPPERFSPPWSGDGAEWPFEQCVAAFHAYCCLSAFATAVPCTAVLHDHSLLPEAAERSAVLGAWLARRGGHLGERGQTFVAGLSRREFTVPPALANEADIVERVMSSPESVFSRRCRNRTLVMRWGRPVVLYWLVGALQEASGQ